MAQDPKEPTEDICDETMARLTPKLRQLVDQHNYAELAIYRDYDAIRKKAEAGEKISAEDFAAANHTFNTRTAGFDDRLESTILEGAFADKVPQPLPPQFSGGSLKPLAAQEIEAMHHAASQRQQHKKQLDNDFYDAKSEKKALAPDERIELESAKMKLYLSPSLDKAYQRDQISQAPRKNLTVNAASIHQPIDLLTQLLANNPGVALGERHESPEAIKLIGDNMAALKKSGVTTLYLEQTPQFFNRLVALPIEEMKKIADQREYESLGEFAAGKSGGDIPAQTIYMMIAAKEQGIRLVNIDVDRINDLSSEPQRVASSNYLWKKIIDDDQKALQDTGQGGGKYIILAGAGHLFNGNFSKGLIDEGVGVPSITFTRADKATSPVFVAEHRVSGPDFYLPGGPDYNDTRKHITAVDSMTLSNVLESVAESGSTSSLKRNLLEKLSDDLRNISHSLDEQASSLPAIPQKPRGKDR